MRNDRILLLQIMKWSHREQAIALLKMKGKPNKDASPVTEEQVYESILNTKEAEVYEAEPDTVQPSASTVTEPNAPLTLLNVISVREPPSTNSEGSTCTFSVPEKLTES